MSGENEKYYDIEEEVWYDSSDAWYYNRTGAGYIAPHGERYYNYDSYQCIHFPMDYIARKTRVYRKIYTKLDLDKFFAGPEEQYKNIVRLFKEYLEHVVQDKVNAEELMFACEDEPRNDLRKLLEPLKFSDWYNNVLWEPEVPAKQVNRPPAERTSFIKALEEAFWEADGPALLVGLAESNPLEFLKICAKLIDPSAKQPSAGLSITFNVAKEEKEINPIDPL